jgi:nucleoid-associated protein YgaU
MDSLRDFAVDAAEVLAAVRATHDAIEAEVGEGTSAARLGNLRAAIAGHLADIRVLRRELDATDVTSLQVHERGDRAIALWTAERDLRRALILVTTELRAVDELAADIALGLRETLYIVRAGETIQAIAAKKLGDWREYPRILEANGLTPADIRAGLALLIPERR